MVVLVLINPYVDAKLFLSLIFETNGLRLTLKSLFTPPTNKLFWSHMKGMAKVRLFYSSAMALILPQLKEIVHFVFFLIVYKEAQIRFTLQLSVCLSFLFCLISLSVFSVLLYFLSVCCVCLSIFVVCLSLLSFLSLCCLSIGLGLKKNKIDQTLTGTSYCLVLQIPSPI